MTTIYIAAPMSEIERAERMHRAAYALGYEETFDWTVQVRADGRPDSAIPTDELRPHLRRDLDAVRVAEVHWMLLPSATRTTEGAWVELGYQLAVLDLAAEDVGERPGIIIASRGEGGRVSPWARCFADLIFDDDAAALAWLRERGA